MRAIVSTAKRDGLTELARELQTRNVTIFSTSGTASALNAEGIEVEPVSALTGFPEILDG
ncbi:MAG: bifunctional phosphoribosylaminoimidazolecarboxamide formyltransferase/IMP cyclohydrolase, partial [Ktedonobacteraceae bacterium]